MLQKGGVVWAVFSDSGPQTESGSHGHKWRFSTGQLVHNTLPGSSGLVNNFMLHGARTAAGLLLCVSHGSGRCWGAVNNPVDNNPLSDGRTVIRYAQFIERTETEGSGWKTAAGSFQDNPR